MAFICHAMKEVPVSGKIPDGFVLEFIEKDFVKKEKTEQEKKEIEKKYLRVQSRLEVI